MAFFPETVTFQTLTLAYNLDTIIRISIPRITQNYLTTQLITMLIGISIVLIFTMLFNIKFNAGVKAVILEDNNMLYYSIINQESASKMTLDFSNVSSKVQRFAILKDNAICQEREIRSDEDINNYEVDMEDLSSGKYSVKITTDENIHVVEEIFV